MRMDDMTRPDEGNPLDMAEQIIMDRDWAFDRPGEAELVTEVAGLWCNYRIWMQYDEEHVLLAFSCALDTKLPKHLHARIFPLLSAANDKLIAGHFALQPEDGALAFRHTQLLKGGTGMTPEQIDHLLDLAVQECERFYPAFQSVVWGGRTVDEAMGLALFETVGEA